jgi:hypothetical protein
VGIQITFVTLPKLLLSLFIRLTTKLLKQWEDHKRKSNAEKRKNGKNLVVVEVNHRVMKRKRKKKSIIPLSPGQSIERERRGGAHVAENLMIGRKGREIEEVQPNEVVEVGGMSARFQRMKDAPILQPWGGMVRYFANMHES